MKTPNDQQSLTVICLPDGWSIYFLEGYAVLPFRLFASWIPGKGYIGPGSQAIN